MRRHLFAAFAALLGACIPVEPEWLVSAPRFRGLRIEVVQPGGYGSLLNVPPGRRRATLLPLDTVELEWFVAALPGVEVQRPIWLACASSCLVLDLFTGAITIDAQELETCPSPLPLNVSSSCRLGEDHRIRLNLGGAYTVGEERLEVLVIGSRRPDLTPATCLDRLMGQPLADLESCIVATWTPRMGPAWAALPFDPAAESVPPEVLAQEADTHPEVIGLAVTRERGTMRSELAVGVGDTVEVRRGERVEVAPLFADGSAQLYLESVGGEEDVPWSGTLRERIERLEHRAWFSSGIDGFDDSYNHWTQEPIEWSVPDDFESTLLYLDVRDDRSGRAFAELLFVTTDDA